MWPTLSVTAFPVWRHTGLLVPKATGDKKELKETTEIRVRKEKEVDQETPVLRVRLVSLVSKENQVLKATRER